MKAKIAHVADFAKQSLGAQIGQPFQWDGRMEGRNTSAPDIYSGSGAPSVTTIPGRAKVGSFYFRIDAANPNLYVCTVAGAPGTWIAIGASATTNFHAEVTITGPQSLTSGSFQKVLWDTIVADPNNNFSIATSLYTCPAAGRYLVTVVLGLNLAAAATLMQMTIQANGLGQLTNGPASNSGGVVYIHDMIIATVVRAAVNDTLGILAFQNSGAAITLGNQFVASYHNSAQFTYLGIL